MPPPLQKLLKELDKQVAVPQYDGRFRRADNTPPELHQDESIRRVLGLSNSSTIGVVFSYLWLAIFAYKVRAYLLIS